MPLTLSNDSVAALAKLPSFFAERFPRQDLINGLEEVDKFYHMENVNIDGDDKDKQEDEEVSTRYKRTDLPIVRQQIQQEVPFMENIFINQVPIFSVVRNKLSPDLRSQAEGVNAKIEQDAQVAGWRFPLSNYHHNCAKYNIGALVPEWTSKSFTNFAVNVNTPTELATEEASWEGNALTSIDPYNFVFDHSVHPSKLPEEGEYAGYIERVSQVKLYADWLKIRDDANAYASAPEALWNSNSQFSQPQHLHFFVPNITSEVNRQTGNAVDWRAFSGSPTDSRLNRFKLLGDPSRHYHKVTMYVRLIPAMFGITAGNAENSRTVQVWKLILINGEHLMYAAPVNNAHDLMPVLCCIPDNDNLGIHGKSNVRCTINMQHLAREFLDRRIASIDRAIEDRAIINDALIDGEQFSRKIPTGKYKLKASAARSGASVTDAYYSIPYRDNSANLLSTEIPFLIQQAQQTNLTNGARGGQFVRGNKTPDEVRETLSNAEAPLLRRAQQHEEQVYSKLKKVFKFNLLQYGEQQDIFSQARSQTFEFTPKTLLETSIEFKLAGGLEPISRAMNEPVLRELFGLVQTNPVIAQQYDVFGIFEDVFYANGINLSDHRIQLPPAAAPGTQQVQQGASVQGQAQAGADPTAAQGGNPANQ